MMRHNNALYPRVKGVNVSRKKRPLWDRLFDINYWLRVILVMMGVPVFYYISLKAIGYDLPFMVVLLGSWVFYLVVVGHYRGWKK